MVRGPDGDRLVKDRLASRIEMGRGRAERESENECEQAHDARDQCSNRQGRLGVWLLAPPASKPETALERKQRGDDGSEKQCHEEKG